MKSLRFPTSIYQRMRDDLDRRHPVAAERVGFAFGGSGSAGQDLIVLFNRYEPVADEYYIDDPTVGARINSSAIRNALQVALSSSVACFHVHYHPGSGEPAPSYTDREGITPIVRSLRQIQPARPHGFLILSDDSAIAYIMNGRESTLAQVDRISVVGYPTRILRR